MARVNEKFEKDQIQSTIGLEGFLTGHSVYRQRVMREISFKAY